jgi:hypothetical protein
MNTALEYSTRVVQEGGRRCKKSTLNDLVHLTPLRIPLMNPPGENKYMSCLGMQDIYTLQDYRVQEYRLPSPPSIKCNVLRESLSEDSQNIPCATLKRIGGRSRVVT